MPLFAGAKDVLDVGCGRGEFLALLKAAGVSARGVDANREMVATARERGLDVVESDALAHLESLADGSLGGLMASQVVEHLAPAYLVRLLATAYQKLRPGAPIVVETINPACWLAFFSSYIRDFTHVRPIHPETLQYLLQANGFGRVTLQYSQPVPEHMKMQPVDVAALAGACGRDAQATAVAQMARDAERERRDSQQPAVHVPRLRRHRLSKLMERIDVAVIGAGVTGLASALARAARGQSVCVLERHPRPGLDVSTHNSGVIHAASTTPPARSSRGSVIEGPAAALRVLRAARRSARAMRKTDRRRGRERDSLNSKRCTSAAPRTASRA